MLSPLLLRRLTIALFVSSLVGLAIGAVEAAEEIWANAWLHYRLLGLVRWQIATSLANWIQLIVLGAVGVYLLRLLLGLRAAGIAGADRFLALATGAGAGALLTVAWGFQLNRYTYKDFWKADNFQPFLGVRLPAGLFSVKLLLINLGIVLVGVAVGYLAYRLLRFLLRRVRGAVTRGTSWWRPALAGTLTIFVGLTLLARHPRSSGPNIILVSVDTLRADRLSSYGNARPTSPNIDSLAQGGVLFENAFSQANWTLPSHLSLMTSQIPDSHAVLYSYQRLPKSKVTLAEILRNAGYQTVAFTGGDFVASRFGFGQGFDSYSDGPPFYYHTSDDWIRYNQAPRLAHILPAVRGWLASRHDEPFFLFVHCWDPHAPYLPHRDHISEFSPRYDGELGAVTVGLVKALEAGTASVSSEDEDRVRALYDNEVRHLDDSFGELLHALRQKSARESLIVFTSDHGDRLMERGIGHGRFLYDAEIHIPLVVVYPSVVPAGPRVRTVVESIDVVPTILDLASIPCPGEVKRELQGRSLRGLWKTRRADSAAYSQSGKGTMRSLRTLRYKYIVATREGQGPEEEVYDLAEDPGESKNLATVRPELLADLRLRHREHLLSLTGGRPPTDPESLELDEGLKERLKALGYLE